MRLNEQWTRREASGLSAGPLTKKDLISRYNSKLSKAPKSDLGDTLGISGIILVDARKTKLDYKDAATRWHHNMEYGGGDIPSSPDPSRTRWAGASYCCPPRHPRLYQHRLLRRHLRGRYLWEMAIRRITVQRRTVRDATTYCLAFETGQMKIVNWDLTSDPIDDIGGVCCGCVAHVASRS